MQQPAHPQTVMQQQVHLQTVKQGAAHKQWSAIVTQDHSVQSRGKPENENTSMVSKQYHEVLG